MSQALQWKHRKPICVIAPNRPSLRNWAPIAEPEKSDAMIEIAAAVCMVGSAQHCRDIVLSFQADSVTPASCMMYGQSELAKWTEGHPNWRIARFTCRPAGKFANL
jgi:hypothetical protein